MLNWGDFRFAVWTLAGRNDAAAEVDLQEGNVVRVCVNGTVETVALRWDVPPCQGVRILGDHWERAYGDLEWRGCVPERVLPWYALLYNPQDASLFGIGVKTGGGAYASWRIDQGGITLVLDVRCGGRPVAKQGRVIDAARLVQLSSKEGESAFAFACRFCALLCDSPRLASRPVFGGNDWYHRYGHITQHTVRTDAANIAALAGGGTHRPFFVIDAGWFDSKDCNGGPYAHGNENFPDMPGLANDISELGAVPGIWMRPLLTTEQVPQSWQVCSSHPNSSANGNTLDPSVPEVVEMAKTDIRRMHAWGYKLIKHDFTTYDITGKWGFEANSGITRAGWTFADTSRTTVQIIRDFYAALREAAGDCILLGCNTAGHLGAGLFEVQRTGDDTSGRHWERTRKMGINTLAFRLPQNNTFFAADADCAGLTQSIPWELNRQWIDLLARSGTPLFVSAHPEALGAAQKQALRAAFARAEKPQPLLEPLDWMDTTAPQRYRQGGETLEYCWNEFAGSAGFCPA